MKKLFMLVPALLLVGCFNSNPEVRLESKVELSNGKSLRWNCEYQSAGCWVDDFKSSRKVSTGIYSDAEYFCDMTGKFYIIRRDVKGNNSYEQNGITCKYSLVKITTTTSKDGTKKINYEYYEKD